MNGSGNKCQFSTRKKVDAHIFDLKKEKEKIDFGLLYFAILTVCRTLRGSNYNFIMHVRLKFVTVEMHFTTHINYRETEKCATYA